MATSTDRVYVEIIAKTNEAVAGLANLVKSVGATYLSWKAFKALIVDSVKEYMKAEEAATKLAAAMRGSGEYTGYALARMKDLSSQLQNTTRYEDDVTQGAMAMLMSLGGLSSKMASDIIPSVQDFASAMGMDLESAATLVAKAIEGNVGALSRYGIKIEEGLDKQGRMAAITDALHEKFGGLAEAMGDTAGGAVIRLGNAFGDMKEEIGRATLTALKPLVSWLTEVATKIGNVMKAANDLRDALSNQAKGIADTNDKLIIANARWADARNWLQMIEDAAGDEAIQIQVMNEATARGYAGINEFKRALQNTIVVERTRAKGLEDQAKREQAAAEAEAERLRKIQEYQDRLATAYGKTDEGQRAALAKEIKFWEESLKATKGGSAEIEAILKDLRAQYDALIPDVENIGKAGSRGSTRRRHHRESSNNYEEANGQLQAYKEMENSLGVIAGSSGDLEENMRLAAEQAAETATTIDEEWKPSFEDLAGLLVDVARTMGEAFASGDITGGLKAIAQQLTNMLSTMALEAAASAAIAQNWPMVALWLGVAGVSAFAGGFLGGMGGTKEGVEVPRMATGGVVTRPTLAMIGEAGPEAVVPLSRSGTGGVNIIVQGSVWQTEDLARAVAGAMSRW